MFAQAYRPVLDILADAVVLCDSEGRFLLLNAAAERLLDQRAENLLGLPIEVIVPDRHRGLLRDSVANCRATCARTPSVGAVELPLLRADGTEVATELLLSWFRTDVGHHVIVGCFRDRREANRHKDEFLAMLAHELRNPLAPIQNAVHLLHMPAAGPAVTQQARQVLQRQVGHLSRLIDNLLDVSRILRGKVELRKEPVELCGLVERAVEGARPALEARGHRLSVTLPPARVRLQADPVRMQQVLVNLLDNAARYTEPGGEVHLRGEWAECEVVLRVRDTGRGMPPDLLGRVFDLFTQAERTLDRSDGGLGIGLTMVRRLVEMHGGRVEAASDGPGRGSEFVVRLPALADPPATAETAGPPAQDRPVPTARRVLVVDDNPDVAESLGMVLRCWGHDVHLAHDGPEALTTARRLRPEVVLLDIGLPGMDGYEVARRLREDGAPEAMLLVAITGYGQEDYRRRSEEAGFQHHLVKPVDLTELNRLVAGA